MTWEPRRLPDVTPENERYWSAAAEGRLLLRSCRQCGLTYHYPRSLCPDCFSDDTEWIEASGRGTVYTYSVTGGDESVPEAEKAVIVAYVELEEGPRMMTNIVDCRPEEISVGTEVSITFEQVASEDIAIPVFTPV